MTWTKKEERLYNLNQGSLNISNKLESLIGDVIVEIPDEDWEKINQYSFFMEQADAYVRKWGVEPEGYNFDYEIMFACDVENDEDYARYIIAHEFGHLILGHADNPIVFSYDDQGEKWFQREKEADSLAEKWGFKNVESTG
jgi:Zn-dependent peptidase ImmA (M78 family)